MRLRVTAIFLLATSFSLLAQTPPPPADGKQIEKIQIADGIYQFKTLRDGYVRQLNSVVIINQNDVLVFDTNTRPSSAALILEEIRKLTPKPVRFLVNSHWHPDHWSGNEVYLAAFPDAEVIASETTADFMRKSANAWPKLFADDVKESEDELKKSIETGKQEDGTPLTPELRARAEDDLKNYTTIAEEQRSLKRIYPTLTYADTLTFHHGGREFRFLSVTGDAEGTTVLYLPKEKILITGDVVSYPVPYVTPPPARHARTLRTLAQLDVDVIIPGHGPAFHDKEFMNLEADFLESVVRGVNAQLLKGVRSLAEIQAAVNGEEFRLRFTHDDPYLNRAFQDRIGYLVKLAIREEMDNKDFR